jgi:hypothetical protein
MQAKAFEIVITLLLSVLVGIGVYFVGELQSCELRIWTLETTSPGYDTLVAKIEGTEKSLKGELDILKELVIKLLIKNGVDTSTLGGRIDGQVESVTDLRRTAQ